MAASQDGEGSVEAKAFQLVLHKLEGLERGMASLPPLLKKMLDHLEAQSQHPEVPVATYAQLYPEFDADPEPDDAGSAPAGTPIPAPRRRPLWRWFYREERP